MAAASGRPGLYSGPRPRPRPGRLRSEKAQRALPGVHHGPAKEDGVHAALAGRRRRETRKAGPLASSQGQWSRAGKDKPNQTPRSADEDRREQGRRREVGVRRQVAGDGSDAPGRRLRLCRLRPPQREPEPHFCPFLSPILSSRAPCVKGSSAAGAGRDRFRPGRCGALQGRPALYSCRLFPPLPPPSGRPPPSGALSALGGHGRTRSGLLALWFPGLASGRGSEDEKNQNVLGMS